MAATPILFKHSTSGRPLNTVDIGVPCRMSPATNKMVFAPFGRFSSRVFLTRVAIRAIPPTSLTCPFSVTLNGNRFPCRSLKNSTVTRITPASLFPGPVPAPPAKPIAAARTNPKSATANDFEISHGFSSSCPGFHPTDRGANLREKIIAQNQKRGWAD